MPRADNKAASPRKMPSCSRARKPPRDTRSRTITTSGCTSIALISHFFPHSRVEDEERAREENKKNLIFIFIKIMKMMNLRDIREKV